MSYNFFRVDKKRTADAPQKGGAIFRSTAHYQTPFSHFAYPICEWNFFQFFSNINRINHIGFDPCGFI